MEPRTSSLRIGIIGTRGIPNAHGGFEEFAENLVSTSVWPADGITFRVYGESPDAEITPWASAVHIPVVKRTHAVRFYLASVRRAMQECDLILCCGVGLGVFALLPRLRGIPLLINPDGCEWRRSKWPAWIRVAVRLSYTPALLAADEVIIDSEALRLDFGRRVARKARYIGYQAPEPRLIPLTDEIRNRFNLVRPYVLVIARLEPENNVSLAIDALRRCADLDLEGIIVGPTTTPHYLDTLAASATARIRFLGGVYDREVLDQLRGGCIAYVHGHTVGGTNPSLLEALARSGGAVLCHDNKYNRETAGGSADYFTTAEDLEKLVRTAAAQQTPRTPLRDDRYTPITIARRYLEAFRAAVTSG